MNGRIDQAVVRKVARLSRLELTAEEIRTFATQLEAILEYVDKLNGLDTENVQPMAHCLPITNRFREDKSAQSLDSDKALANAPERDGAFFKVPRILGDYTA